MSHSLEFLVVDGVLGTVDHSSNYYILKALASDEERAFSLLAHCNKNPAGHIIHWAKSNPQWDIAEYFMNAAKRGYVCAPWDATQKLRLSSKLAENLLVWANAQTGFKNRLITIQRGDHVRLLPSIDAQTMSALYIGDVVELVDGPFAEGYHQIRVTSSKSECLVGKSGFYKFHADEIGLVGPTKIKPFQREVKITATRRFRGASYKGPAKGGEPIALRGDSVRLLGNGEHRGDCDLGSPYCALYPVQLADGKTGHVAILDREINDSEIVEAIVTDDKPVAKKRKLKTKEPIVANEEVMLSPEDQVTVTLIEDRGIRTQREAGKFKGGDYACRDGKITILSAPMFKDECGLPKPHALYKVRNVVSKREYYLSIYDSEITMGKKGIQVERIITLTDMRYLRNSPEATTAARELPKGAKITVVGEKITPATAPKNAGIYPVRVGKSDTGYMLINDQEIAKAKVVVVDDPTQEELLSAQEELAKLKIQQEADAARAKKLEAELEEIRKCSVSGKELEELRNRAYSRPEVDRISTLTEPRILYHHQDMRHDPENTVMPSNSRIIILSYGIVSGKYLPEGHQIYRVVYTAENKEGFVVLPAYEFSNAKCVDPIHKQEDEREQAKLIQRDLQDKLYNYQVKIDSLSRDNASLMEKLQRKSEISTASEPAPTLRQRVDHALEHPIAQELATDAEDAAWRTAAKQLTKLARDPLCAMLQRHLAPGDEAFRARIGDFLQTEIGTALFASLLSLAMSQMPVAQSARLSKELRIAAMAGAGNVVADLFMGPLREVMVGALSGVAIPAKAMECLPESTGTKLTVSQTIVMEPAGK